MAANSRQSKKAKKAKRWHRLEHDRFVQRRAIPEESGPPTVFTLPGATGRGPGGRIIGFEIVHDAIPNPLVEALPPADRDRVNAGLEAFHNDKAGSLEVLKGLIDEFPHIPCLWNHLSISHAVRGEHDEADRLVEETYRRFPDYLFAMVGLLGLLMRDGRMDEARALVDGRLGIHQWFPGQTRFHATEWVVFNGMIGLYCCEIGDVDSAMDAGDLIDDVLPDHDMAITLRARIQLELIRELAQDSMRPDSRMFTRSMPPLVIASNPLLSRAGAV